MTNNIVKFKVGDIVKGTSGRYSVTNHKMTKGKVIKVSEFQGQQVLDIQILEMNDPSLQHEVGIAYDSCYARHFEKVNNITLDSLKFEYDSQLKGTFITIDKKHIVFVNAKPEDLGVSSLSEKQDPIETAKALALYRAK
jgi:hypothetical protein